MAGGTASRRRIARAGTRKCDSASARGETGRYFWPQRDYLAALQPKDVAQVGDAQQLGHGQVDPQFGIGAWQRLGQLRVHLVLKEMPDQGGGLFMGGRTAQDRQQRGA